MIGKTLDHYRIVDRIGAGGMGIVYRAVDERLKRDVAVKVLPAGTLDDESARRRFRQEALTLSRLNHPHIATIFDFFTQEDTDFLVMEYIEGPTLSELLREGPLPEKRVAALGAQIVDALAEAHEHGIVHRDFKPGNIIVTSKGQAKVLDFGLAKLLEPLSEEAPTLEKTEKGVARGTVPYMSPEQLLGEPVGPTSDVYAAGAVLYEMATGRRPHPELQGPRLIDAILHKEPEAPSSLRPEIPRELEDIILQSLQKQPSRRIQTACELSDELKRISISLSLPATTRRPSVSSLRWLVVAAALVFGAASLWVWSRADPSSVGESDSALPASPVIAVLPFANLSGDPSIDYLGIGIAHSLITSLSSLPSLTVVSPSATLGAENAASSPEQIARDHGVTYVLTGAVQRAGERIQLAANLVRPDSSVAWGGASEGALEELFDMQHSLAENLIGALQPSFPADERRRLTSPPTRNAGAYADYTQAYAFLERPDVPGNIDRSLELFQSSIEKDPQFAVAHAGLGEAYWRQYRRTGESSWTDRARDATTEALRLDPDAARVRYSLAVIYEGTGRSELAIEELNRSLELQSNNDDAHRLLAEILASRGELDAAVVQLEHAIRIRPNFWGNHRALGLAFYRAGELEKAAASLTRVTELQPDSPWGFQTLGAVHHVAGDVERAIENYERAIELGPSPASYSNLGTIHYRRGNFEEAIRLYEESLALRPNSTIGHRNLGDAYRRLGREQEARSSYGRAKEIAEARLLVNPRDATVIGSLAVYEAKLGESEPARRHAAEAVALAPGESEVLYHSAVVHALFGENDDALRFLAEALARGYSISEALQDEDLDGLKGLAEYERLMQRYR